MLAGMNEPLAPMNEPPAPVSPAREAVIFGTCLGVGLLVMPLLTYLAGELVLGPYAGGSAGQIIENEFRGLGAGALSSWIIALAPYVMVQIVRAVWHSDRLRMRLWPERAALESRERGARSGE